MSGAGIQSAIPNAQTRATVISRISRPHACHLSSYLMLRDRRISGQGLTLCQAANYQCGLLRRRGLTQGQALRAA
jgi:hypothetical protein